MKIKSIVVTALCITALSGISKENLNTVGENTRSVNYELAKHTVSSGGGVTSAGIYSVTASIGQIDAGHSTTGGVYQFNGGLFAQAGNDLIFRNSFE